MKYNLAEFKKEVSYYKKILNKKEISKEIFVIFDIKNKKSFYSLAPLSLAVHTLDKEMYVIDSKRNMINVLRKFYKLNVELNEKKLNEKTKALKKFIDIVNEKTKNEFKKIIKIPSTILISKNKKWHKLSGKDFIKGDDEKPFAEIKSSWFKPYKYKGLLKTAKIIWKEVYALKKSETANIEFELIHTEKIRKLPLEDYLDSYSVAYSMAEIAEKNCEKVLMSSSTAKENQLSSPTNIADLAMTLKGCELEKDIDELVFKKFKKLSKYINSGKIKNPSASFTIKGEGYPGKHIFGECIGYPTKNKKTRWHRPNQILLQLAWWPQTKFENRMPKMRHAITDTIPIDLFIETNYIDWNKLEKRNKEIIKIIDKCDSIKVKANNSKTDFAVYLKSKKRRRKAISSGTETNSIIDKAYFKETKIYAGSYGNIPGGEAFLTPEYIEGLFIGDVVINVNRSYIIPKKNPLKIKCNKKGYKILSGDKKIINAITKNKKDALKKLKLMEKNKSISEKNADLQRKNHENIGEFAINTNPKARLSDYLIVNEKIANMIHIALGSGFDEDKEATYHYDIVIDAKSQKTDIYGIKNGIKGKEKLWILKKGRFVV